MREMPTRSRRRRACPASLLALLCAAALEGQAWSATAAAPSRRGDETNEARRLGLQEAIDLGLSRNVSVLLADAAIEAAAGARQEALSRLFPHLDADVTESRLKINLEAYGFPPPAGESSVIGPFGLFDARLGLGQTLYDAEALQRAAAARHRLEAERLDARATRQSVAAAVADLYLEALASEAAIEASQAEVATAETTLRTADDRHRAGTAAGIDVVRARLTLSRERQRLIAARNRYDKDLLALERAIGLAIGEPLELVDRLPFQPPEQAGLDSALAAARAQRPDLAGAEARIAAADATLSAARRQRVPSLEAHGDYGSIGSRLGAAQDTFGVSASVHVPLFDGRRIAGEVRRARAQRRAAELQHDDLEQKLAVEVRSAWLDLDAAARQVEVAEDGVDLAALQLEQARDRFAAGIGDSLEVAVAQEAVAAANAQHVASLHAYGRAKVDLALATGSADGALASLLLGVP